MVNRLRLGSKGKSATSSSSFWISSFVFSNVSSAWILASSSVDRGSWAFGRSSIEGF